MDENSNQQDIDNEFEKIYSEYSDDELIEVLKKRNHYRKEAAGQAVREAIKRGIIHSGQDLFGEKYKVSPLRFRWIPEIENPAAKNKIRKSIARSLMIAGILPLVWGGVKIFRGLHAEGLLLMVLGFVWVYVSLEIYRNIVQRLAILFVLLAGAFAYMLRFFLIQKNLLLMDFFIAAIVFGLALYGLLFLRKLLK